MDNINRGFRPNPEQNTHEPQQAHSVAHAPLDEKKPGKKNRFKSNGLLSASYIFLLFSVTIVLVGLLVTLVLFKNSSKEEGFVEANKYQSIFLNNGQVYFGHINELNKDYLSISDIYYLRVNQQVQPDRKASQNNDVSLVKLGCELHGPQDSMVVNRNQVTFWENLKDDGQVATAVAEYKKANPNGQDCKQEQSQSTGSTSTGSSDTNSSDAKKDNTSNNNAETPSTTP